MKKLLTFCLTALCMTVQAQLTTYPEGLRTGMPHNDDIRCVSKCRVGNIQEGRLFNICVNFNPKYDKQPGQRIDGVTFRNITYNGMGENPPLIKGLDKERMVRNVTFENVVINGEKIKDLSGFITNEYIEKVEVK